MADFGTIAAAVQLAETAYKLKKLFTGIRDAPSDLLSLVDEVIVLADLLSDIDQTTCDQVTANLKSWKRCHELFKSSADSIQQLTTDLEHFLQSNRFTGSVKIYLKREQVSKCKERLERVKGTMMLAQQAYLQAALNRDSSTLHEIHAIATQLQVANVTAPLKSSANVLTEGVPGVSVNTSQLVLQKKKPKTRRAYNFQLPTWILRCGVQVLTERSASSWGFTIRCYNRVSDDAPVLKAARERDWDLVKCLFADRRASPFDLDKWDETLLHYAARQMNFDACKMLLGYGLDPASRAWIDETPLDCFSHKFWIPSTRYFDFEDQEADTTLLLLLNSYSEVLDGPEIYEGEILRLLGYFDHRRILLIKKSVMPWYQNVSFATRANAVVFGLWSDPQSIYAVLGEDLTLSRAFELTSDNDYEGKCVGHLHMLQNITQVLGKHLVEEFLSESALQEWKTILSEIIRYESGSIGKSSIHSPLRSFIAEYSSEQFLHGHPVPDSWNDYFTVVGRVWVALLADLGADLERYGQAEKAHVLQEGRFADIELVSRGWTWNSFKISGLLTGPNVEDWKLFVVPTDLCHKISSEPGNWIYEVRGCREYEMAGEFWDWVENPELFAIPGTYSTFFDECEKQWHEQGNYLVYIDSPMF